MKVVRLSGLSTGLLFSPGDTLDTHFCYRLSQSQGHSAAGRIMAMKNSSDTTGNGTCDIPACSIVPQSTALPRAPLKYSRTPLIHTLVIRVGLVLRGNMSRIVQN